MSALENSGRLPASAYAGATMYTTLSPCDMCTGACILYKINRVVIGENESFMGGEELLLNKGKEVVVLDNQECKHLMATFMKEKPELWLVIQVAVFIISLKLTKSAVQERGHCRLNHNECQTNGVEAFDKTFNSFKWIPPYISSIDRVF